MSYFKPHAYIRDDHSPNFVTQHHAFPYDFRAGPSLLDWDPSKWIILILYHLGLATALRRARTDEVEDAKHVMHSKVQGSGQLLDTCDDSDSWNGPVWSIDKIVEYMTGLGHEHAPCLMVIDNFVIDATGYMKEHVRPFWN